MKKIIISVLSALVAFSSIAAAAEATVMAEQTEKQSKKAKAELKDVTFNVHLHCHSCVKKIQENIAFEKGVKDLKVCLEDQIVSIKYDSAKTNEETLKNALIKLGIKVTGISESGHHHTH